MNDNLLRYSATLLLGLGVFSVGPAQAAIECTASISNVVFGNVDPQSSQTDASATLTYTCKNEGLLVVPPRAATVCFSIGEPGGGSMNPRQMKDTASNTLNFQLYQDSARAIVWGSQFIGAADPLMVSFSLSGGFGGGGSITSTATVYGRVLVGQSAAVPGSYTSNYGAADTAITINQTSGPGSTPPGSCSTTRSGNFGSFIVSANVVKKCTVTASPLNFGSVGLLTSETSATTTLGVQCSSTTPYHVGLGAGQNSSDDINARKMALGSHRIDYQLYQNPARTLIWGNTVGTDTVAGTGTGLTQSLPVYGTVPAQATPPAGTYSDTVVVTITY